MVRPHISGWLCEIVCHKTTRYWQTTIRRSEDRADLMCKVPKAARWFYLLRARP